MNRRQILTAAAAGVGTLALKGVAAAQPKQIRYPLGCQFFTFGAAAAGGWDNYARAMETARNIGFEMLEMAGFSAYKPEQIRKRAEELGLRLRSIHMGNDQQAAFMAPDRNVALAQDAVYTPIGIVQVARVNLAPARDMGCEYGIIGASGRSNFKSLEAVRRICDSFNEASDYAKTLGMKLSYHMHAPDFAPVEGRVPFDYILENTSADIRYQMDVCWALAGGADPVDVLARHADRLVSLHLKDLTADKKVATAGDGLVNFPGIFKESKKIKDPLFYVERDGGPGVDTIKEATRAYAYLHKLGWGTRA